MHEQVTMLRKLLSHIFEQYADVQDDGYISDEDIEEYPETFYAKTVHNGDRSTGTGTTIAAGHCTRFSSPQH